jgi:hypothetical protein
MDKGIQLERYSMGIGDRFCLEGKAQLEAIYYALMAGVPISPVWNKSNREHMLVKTSPRQTWEEAIKAVKDLNWQSSFYVDADHINLKNVDWFLDSSNFFTIDVADAIGKQGDIRGTDIKDFKRRNSWLIDMKIEIEGIDRPLQFDHSDLNSIALNYLWAAKQAAQVYRHIEERKGRGNFITEVSMDETAVPQNPLELLVILAALHDQGVPLQTIAPKFTGEFLKGVDYVGNPKFFEREFRDDLAVIRYAKKYLGLPYDLKLSVHSGSDKFSLYPLMHQAMKDFDAGVHLKTAGTTWLEEVIGLAEGNSEGLHIAKMIYEKAYANLKRYRIGDPESIMTPYSTVVQIDMKNLPDPDDVNAWSEEQFASALRHDQSNPLYNRDFRQLIHISYGIAATQIGQRFHEGLIDCRTSIEDNVKYNLLERHIKPLFLGK